MRPGGTAGVPLIITWLLRRQSELTIPVVQDVDGAVAISVAWILTAPDATLSVGRPE